MSFSPSAGQLWPSDHVARQFAAHTVERAYHAVVWGCPRKPEGLIEGQIGRNPFDRKRMGVLRGGGKEARTRYRVLERFGSEARPFASLIECRLETGRTHQIRVHLSHLGFPIAGDSKYGDFARNKELAKRGLKRMFLHAHSIAFKHPLTGESMSFTAPLPKELQGFIDKLGAAQ